MNEMVNPTGADIAQDLIQETKTDREIILEKLPEEFNKKFRADKWFNIFSGELKDSSVSNREGSSVNVYSNPIGAAFDIGGIWSGSDLKQYVEARKASGYYRRYAAATRAGMIQGGKLANKKKRVPFLAKVVYKTDSIIASILKAEGRL